jgi:hypothetical protein
MSESWYYVDSGGSVGPVTTLELRETLRALPDWKDVLVWSADISDWKKASEVSEIRTRLATSPPVPTSHFSEQMPTWQVRWWWYLAALSFFGSVGSRDGRDVMAWASDMRLFDDRCGA